MIIKIHRTWVIKDVGPSFQGCAPDIIELGEFETREEAEAYKEKYEQKMKGKHWMGTIHIIQRDRDILE